VVACVPLLLLAGAVSLPAQTAVPPLFRLFLTDGTEVTTYGEFARLDEQVVAAVPVGRLDAPVPDLQTVTVAARHVDWPKTEAYLQAVRLAQYTASTAERDYAAFAEDVAYTLDQVATTPDPLARIGIVERARTRLIEWPRQHYGYRQQDAVAMLAVLDDVLAGLRAAAGQQHFTLTLASGTAVPPAPAVRPLPTLRDVVSQALALSRHLVDPAERTRLLGHVLGLLDGDHDWDRAWVRKMRRDTRSALETERTTTRAYTSLRDRVLARAATLLEKADVRSLMALRADTLSRDERLGRQRPSEMAALLAQLDLQLDDARQLRLALDRWDARRPVVEAYVRATSDLIETLRPLVRALDDIRALSGPSTFGLDRADGVLAGAQMRLQQALTPEEAGPVQALMAAALQMAAHAVRTRRAAMTTGDMNIAWEASAAAAGALMTLERARTDLAHLADAPRPGTPAQGTSR
jgi:hypothetical protein